MTINKIVLTPEQAGWFSRNILKMIQLLESSERKNPNVKERSTYKTMVSMKQMATEAGAVVDAFGEEELYDVEVMLTPKQKKVIKDLVGSVHKNLIEKVIPAYEEKLGHKITNKKINYQEYLDNAKAKAVGLELIFKKVK